MRTAILPLFALVGLAAGCNTYTTVDESCLDTVPGLTNMTQQADRDIYLRFNCYRRLAKRPRVGVSGPIQEALEAHRDYLTIHAPQPETMQTQSGGEGFTGTSSLDRLDEAGYIFPSYSELLDLLLFEDGAAAGLWTGDEHFQLWFDDPFVRPSFLQPTMLASGLVEGSYVRTFGADSNIEDLPVSYMYWNLVYQKPTTAYAEPAVVYPRNGQLDAPATYVHVSSSTELDFGKTYGYPITFTVGSSETNLEVTQASLRRVAPECENVDPEDPTSSCSLPFVLLQGRDAITALRLTNTAIMVPEQAFQQGQTYQANMRIETDQGSRTARTKFTVGGDARTIPPELLTRIAEEIGRPLYSFELTRRDPTVLD